MIQKISDDYLANKDGKMRVLILSNWFPPITTGSSFYTSSLAQSLAARGHEVIVVTLDWGPAYAPLDTLPFPIYRLPTIKIPKSPLFYNLELMGFSYTPMNKQRLKMLIEQYHPHLLHHINHIFDTAFLLQRSPTQRGYRWLALSRLPYNIRILGCSGSWDWSTV